MCIAQAAHAFCGFYVAGGDQQMFNDATQVVLMRKGTRTVLAMQNNYKGPPEDFAMVIPVPVVLHEGDVKTLPKDVFEHVERDGRAAARRVLGAGSVQHGRRERDDGMAHDAGARRCRRRSSGSAADGLRVTIEAQFAVGEYQIVILSAKDSTGLDTWLQRAELQDPRRRRAAAAAVRRERHRSSSSRRSIRRR